MDTDNFRLEQKEEKKGGHRAYFQVRTRGGKLWLT